MSTDYYMIDDRTGEVRKEIIVDEYDQSCEEAAEDAYNNLVRSLIEASAEINSLKDDKRRLLEMLDQTANALTLTLATYDGCFEEELGETLYKAGIVLYELGGES